MTKQLNTRRAQLLKTEKNAVYDLHGNTTQISEILCSALGVDSVGITELERLFYYIKDNSWYALGGLKDGYTAHPISWFYEADEAVKPTFEQLKAMSLKDRIEALKKMGYVDGVEYRCANDGKKYIVNTKSLSFGKLVGIIGIDAGGCFGYLYRDGKWAEIISKPDEAPQPEYVKVVKCENPSRWYSGKIGEPFKVESQDCEAYTVTYNGASNFYIIYTSDCTPCDANGTPIGEQPEAEIIGWELMIDVPEWGGKTGKSFKLRRTGVWSFDKLILPESILRDMKSARPIYKRTTEDILNAVKDGTMTVEDAVKELEQNKIA